MKMIDDDVVISGIGGYFPKSANIDEFKTHLFNHDEMMEPFWPEGERGVCNRVGKVPGPDYFDNTFFGIHRQQTLYMDPMQRVILERTYEALTDAGINPTEVRGRKIGVYIGSSIGENDTVMLESVVSGFGITGHARAMISNRISYWLNLYGPSVAYDFNWIAGLEVLRMAYTAIKTGQCEAAIIGGANLLYNSSFQWLYDDMGLLSSDGTTRAFDAQASGYGRSDGVVVMYLQRASEARRSYASIVHIASRFDGNYDGGVLTIDEDNMVELIEEFYEKCPVKPDQIEFVETNGCAIKKIDKAEVNALERVYCKNRKNPLLIGSVKTQAGHSEPTSLLFAIAKVIIAMESGTIPAYIPNFNPNPEIPALHNGHVEVLTENRAWKGQYAAINGLGIDSYYGHIVLKSNGKEKVPIETELPTLLLASTRTEEGIAEILETLKSKPNDQEYYRLVQEVFTKPIPGHLYRGYSLLGSGEVKQESAYHVGKKCPIWFVYSGMGSQWCGMVGDLMKIEIFSKSIMKSHDVLATKGLDLLNIITTNDKTVFDNILNSFVGIAAIQIALTDVVTAVGIEPDGIIGHSVGELGCAYADGCLTHEEMILAAYCRGRASLEANLIRGMMAAVGIGYHDIKDRLPPSIEVACHNSAESCTISGPAEDMEKFVKELQDEKIFARLVNVGNIAYHSRYVKPAAPLLLKYLNEANLKTVARSSKWISTSNVESNWGTDLAKHSSAEYHTNNLLNSVLFEEGIKHIPKDSILIEIAPHGLLQAILKRSLTTVVNIPLTLRGHKSGLEFLLQSFGKLYLAGVDLNIANIYPKIEYPVSRNTPSLADLAKWNHSELWQQEAATHIHAGRDIQAKLSDEEFSVCVSHQLNENAVLPVSYYLNLIYQQSEGFFTDINEVVFENLLFNRPLIIPRSDSVNIRAMFQRGTGEFEITSKTDIIATGKIIFPQSGDEFLIDPVKVEVSDENVKLSANDFYNEFYHRGHNYTGPFRSVKSLTLAEEGSVSTVEWTNTWTYLLEAMIQQQLLHMGERNQEVLVPKVIQKIAISLKDLPSEETSEVQVDYDYDMKMVTTNGMQLIGMTTTPLTHEKRKVHLDAIECLPLNNSFTKIESGIELAIHLTLANFDNGQLETIFLTELEAERSLNENIRNVLNECIQFQIYVNTVSEARDIVIQQSYPQLIIVNSVVADDILNLIKNSKTFLMTISNKNLLAEADLIEVAQFRVGDVSYSIIKKEYNAKVTSVNVKANTVSLQDLKNSSLPWVSELYSALKESNTKPVFLISSTIPTEGYLHFVQELRSLPNMQNVRVIFDLDKKRRDFAHLFKQNLPLVVLKDGVQSTCVPFSLKFREDLELNPTTSIIKNNNVRYIGINLKDETLNVEDSKQDDIGNVDYSAINGSGESIMGLARLDKHSSRLVPDPILTWKVPEYLSLEDAATIPNAYACAYYMLVIKGRLRPGDNVLIHAGCSTIGQAAASIAAYYGCQVFVTVSSHIQKAFLREKFNFLKNRHILSSDDASFEMQLRMTTGGRGAEVILNCLSGSLLQNSIDCAADYCRFIQYGKRDLEEGNSFGTYGFLRNISLYVVNLDNIFAQPKEVKEEIQKLVDEGMQMLVVRPFVREVVAHNKIAEMLSKMKSKSSTGKVVMRVDNSLNVSKLNVNNPNKFICNSDGTYLIYGGSAENWCDIAEWLVLRGATKIIVATDSKPRENYINRRLSLLQSYYDTVIIMAPNKAGSKEGAAELLSEVRFVGPIEAVFTLPSEASDLNHLRYLDETLRRVAPKALLVNFVDSGWGICHGREQAGFSTYNIMRQENDDLVSSICGLDKILSTKLTHVLVKNDKAGDEKKGKSQGGIKDLGKILPSPEDMIKEQQLASEEPELVQLISEGPMEIRELAPIFIVPGLSGRSELREMVKTLLYPTFLLSLPTKASWTLEELAKVYVEKMRAVYPPGVYNIIALSWGGALAIEIARLLHKENASLHLFFVDSAPNTIQETIRQLGETKDDLEINMLRRIFDINDAELLENLKSTNDWESRIKLSLEGYGGTQHNQQLLKNGLNCLRSHIDNIMAFQQNDVLVSGVVHLIRPTDSNKDDSCGLISYFKQPPQIVLTVGDHLSIIINKETIEYINHSHQLD